MLIRGSPNGARHTIHTLVAIGRNRWSSSIGTSGRHQSESVVAMARCAQLVVEMGVPKLRGVRRPPYPTGPQALLVTVDAAEVVGCHLAF